MLEASSQTELVPQSIAIAPYHLATAVGYAGAQMASRFKPDPRSTSLTIVRPTRQVVWYEGPAVLALADELHDVYADAFSGPPWNKQQAGIDQFRHRLDTDAHRAGFRAVVTTSPAGIDGFATGWITGQPFRSDRAYAMVAAQLGPQRVARMLLGALEVDELAVRPRARLGGLGRQLLGELISDAPGGRAWLLTSPQITDTVAFYRRVGWHGVPPLPGKDNGIVVFLSPAHPARDTPAPPRPGRSHHGE